MTINKFNYEAFALDYLEGNLSVELTEEMERFLKTHPAIEAELSGMMELVYLAPDTSIVFDNKELLLKEKKVAWLAKSWIRPLMAAASVAILLMTYLVGYQTGAKQVEEVAILDGAELKSNNSLDVESTIIEEYGAEEESSTLPIAKVTKTVETVIPKKSKLVIKPSSKDDFKQLTTQKPLESQVDETIAEELPVIDNEIFNSSAPVEVVVLNSISIITPIQVITPTLIEPNHSANNLANALEADLPVPIFAKNINPKKKRNIKDLLGRFPVTQLKEALIPTYYKEENVGQ